MSTTTTIKPGTRVWVVLQLPKFHVAAGEYECRDEGRTYSHLVRVDCAGVAVRNVLDVYATEAEARAAAIQKCKDRIADLQRQLAELEGASDL